MEMISVNNICKSYKKIIALQNVNFNISSGEIVGYLGPNGSGKTTTIKVLCNLIKPDSGKISIMNQDVLKNYNKIGNKIGVVFENHGLYLSLTASENLEFYARLFGLSNKQSIVDNLLEKVDLYSRKNSLIKTYSKGMLRKLTIARAILNNPKILILDEPFDGIDVESRHTIINMLKNWVVDDERCIIMTSHNMSDIESICNKIVLIKSGKILYSDTVMNLKCESENISFEISFIDMPKTLILKNLFDDLVNSGKCREYYIHGNKVIVKSHSINMASELAAIILQNNLSFQEIKTQQENLEELYLRMVK